jgi:di/tricarboxylate transporter
MWHDPHILRMILVLAVVAGIVGLYAFELFSIELVSVAGIAVFLLLFQLWPVPDSTFGAEQILAGFANPALISILALLVVGQGMFHTGAMEGPSRVLAASYDRHPTLTMGALFGFVMLVSAFINNTPVVVMFVPVLVTIAARIGTSASRVMIPLSYVSILAGMTTLIGSSTNILVADVLKHEYGISLDFFSLAPIGLVLALTGVLYLLFVGVRLLPKREGVSQARNSGRQYIAQIEITPQNPHLGEAPIAGMFPHLQTVTVRMVQRGTRIFYPPYDEEATLEEGDVVTVAATRKALSELLVSDPDILSGMLRGGANEGDDNPEGALAITEAVVAPGSRYEGQTLEQIGLRVRTGCIVLGIQRRSHMMRQKLSTIRLQAGDDLLLFGTRESLRNLRFNRDLLVLLWSMADVPDIRRAGRARLIFGAVILAVASGLLSIVDAALGGAVAMVAFGCLNLRQAARALDLRIYLLIGAAFAMGASLQESGAATLMADAAVQAAMPYGPITLLVGLFALVAVLTNILSNAATAVLFAPIAVNAAVQFADTPQMEAKLAVAAVMTVIYAANCSFATPIAYQTNLLVMGPGHYKFVDYLKVGGPLVVLLWLVFMLIAPYAFGL